MPINNGYDYLSRVGLGVGAPLERLIILVLLLPEDSSLSGTSPVAVGSSILFQGGIIVVQPQMQKSMIRALTG